MSSKSAFASLALGSVFSLAACAPALPPKPAPSKFEQPVYIPAEAPLEPLTATAPVVPAAPVAPQEKIIVALACADSVENVQKIPTQEYKPFQTVILDIGTTTIKHMEGQQRGVACEVLAVVANKGEDGQQSLQVREQAPLNVECFRSDGKTPSIYPIDGGAVFTITSANPVSSSAAEEQDTGPRSGDLCTVRPTVRPAAPRP
jgi:hypothetical protein